jgi:predicted amidohydrolase
VGFARSTLLGFFFFFESWVERGSRRNGRKKEKRKMLFLLVLCFAALGHGYVAAVLQHTHSKTGASPLEVKLNNLRIYAAEMEKAKLQGNVDIFVTPEVGLGHDEISRSANKRFGERIPSAGGPIPCFKNDSSSPTTNAASCLARAQGMALVVGTIDLQPCSNETACPSDGLMVYNTALVFDETGALVAKYHKYHLFSVCDGCFDRPPKPQVVSFKLFGVDFGVLICFDSLFQEPSGKLHIYLYVLAVFF